MFFKTLIKYLDIYSLRSELAETRETLSQEVKIEQLNEQVQRSVLKIVKNHFTFLRPTSWGNLAQISSNITHIKSSYYTGCI